ncbi:MAG: sugar-transfer associated ATP-grasp domain-containing protein [Bacteroidales bacterium]|nr:sugar-transfer associated ATP-grasp domain-containing protein [Bacteroidales bacterium]
MKNKIKSLIQSIGYSHLAEGVYKFGGGKLWADLNIFFFKRKLLANAKKEFAKKGALGSLKDYKQALKKHWVTYSEYSEKYEFYKKTEEQRDEYVSTLKMGYFYRRYCPMAPKAIFRDKSRFLEVYGEYVHRKWLYIPKASFVEFEKMIASYDCIAKPLDESRGKGILKICKDDSEKNVQKLYDFFVRNNYLLEQCIENCDELKALHPQSLNTLRIVTISNKEKACVFSGVLRAGVGDNVIDNSHAGGLSAQINVKSGVVETDGADSNGNRYEYHPDSNIKIKGFVIPYWDIIVKTCCEAAKRSAIPIVGWDVVANNEGVIELIEGNHRPDMDVMQVRYNAGVKKQVFALIKEYCGIEMK